MFSKSLASVYEEILTFQRPHPLYINKILGTIRHVCDLSIQLKGYPLYEEVTNFYHTLEHG